jgi:hypothetical protein
MEFLPTEMILMETMPLTPARQAHDQDKDQLQRLSNAAFLLQESYLILCLGQAILKIEH